jgi:hypothetical protein
MLVFDTECNLAVELDEAPVSVVAEAGILGQLDQALQRGLVEAEIEDGIHHARHGHRRARAHGNQQRIVGATELFAGLLFEILHVLQDLLPSALGKLIMVQVSLAGIGGDRETRRNVEADLRHLAQIGALAAEQHLVLAVAFLESKYPFQVSPRLCRGTHQGLTFTTVCVNF